MVSQKRIDKIVEENKSALKALEEFEKTGRLIIKSRMNFTIDKNISRKFREYCRNNNINMSKIIEESMKRVVE